MFRKPLTLPRLKAEDSFPASTRNAGFRRSYSQSTGVSRLRVSFGDDPQTFHTHVFGSVGVPQVMGSTPGTSPLPIGERKVVVFVSAFGAQLARRKEPVYRDEVLAVPQGFILDLACFMILYTTGEQNANTASPQNVLYPALIDSALLRELVTVPQRGG